MNEMQARPDKGGLTNTEKTLAGKQVNRLNALSIRSKQARDELRECERILKAPIGQDPAAVQDLQVEVQTRARIARARVEETRRELDESRFVLDLTTGVLNNLGGDAAVAGRALSATGGAVLNVIFAQTLSTALSSVAVPLAVLNGVTTLMSLLGPSGPNTAAMTLDELQLLHREIANVMESNARNTAQLQWDIKEGNQHLLDRVGAAEDALSDQIRGVREVVDRIEVMFGQLERLMVEQNTRILDRFKDIHNGQYKLQSGSFDGRKRPLLDESKVGNKPVEKEVDDFASFFTYFSTEAASSLTLAGGDAQLNENGNLLGFFHGVTWAEVNNVFNLSRIAENPLPNSAGLVNPEIWWLAVNKYLEVAETTRDVFFRPAVQEVHRRQLAQLYLAGERLRQGLWTLTSKSDGAPRSPNPVLFAWLLDRMTQKVNEFEASLTGAASELQAQIGAAWADNPLQPADGVIKLHRLFVDPQLNNLPQRGYDTPKPEKLILTDADQKTLEKTLPDSIRLAVQLKGQGAPGGKVNFYIDAIRWEDVIPPDPYLVPFGLQDAPNMSQPWRGVPTVGVRAELLLLGESRPRTLYHRWIKCLERCEIGRVEMWVPRDPASPHHRPLDWSGEGRIIGSAGREADTDRELVWLVKEPQDQRARMVERHWDELKKGLLTKPDPKGEPGLFYAADLVSQMEAWTTGYVVEKITNVNRDVQGQIVNQVGPLGKAILEMDRLQRAMLLCATLALPSEMRPGASSNLTAKIAGELAPLNGRLLISMMRPVQTKDGKVEGALVPVPGIAPKPPPIPIVVEMRRRIDELRNALNKAVENQASSQSPPRHDLIDSMLMRIVFFARSLKIDLKSELLKNEGLSIDPTWIVEEVSEKRLAEDWSKLERFAAGDVAPP